ncbi:DNA phosphorothioation-dependent restriction protein DptF [Bacillus cereus]|uniref:DNA phosphorothioation-dependent restriction protein DptF n=1 Tax=Bacillus cereus TaxID=1396 RepID=UPI002ADEE266|nr:DNA phosphorothioation-dependent restriction protein DptF [Bacillus cereus]MEA1011860.1 DNA phosphorothioation-dependent restriction protein DptF [Bacillus cereus]
MNNIVPSSESKFLNQIKMLQSSSKETVVHTNTFSSFTKYMHTKRMIEDKIIEALKSLEKQDEKQLILLCGSVGDGKSHLLSYLNSAYSSLFSNVFVHNDATESYNPNESSIETLERILKGFNEGHTPTHHTIVAINLGVMHNFYISQMEKGQFVQLRKFIDDNGVFDENASFTGKNYDKRFQLYNFATERVFTLTSEGPRSPFLESIFTKIVQGNSGNPIYKAWKQDVEAGILTIAHANYQLLQNETIRARVLEKIYHVILRDKIMLSTRAFYNFIFTIIVPAELELNQNKTGFSIENTLPNLLFNHPDRSPLLEKIYTIDPLHIRVKENDELISNLYILSEKQVFIQNIFNECEIDWQSDIYRNVYQQAIEKNQLQELSKFIIRMKDLAESTVYETFHDFVKYLYCFHTGDNKLMMKLFTVVKEAFIKWKGSPQPNYYFVSNDLNRPHRLAFQLKLREYVGEMFGAQASNEVIFQFDNYITLGFCKSEFNLDLRLYELLLKVKDGYRPNKNEMNIAIQFEDFYKQLLSTAEQDSDEVMIVRSADKSKYLITKPSFGSVKFEVEKVR